MALTDKKENTVAIDTVIKNFSVNNELLTESDINFFKTVTSSTEQGKEISLNEAEIEIYKAFKANVALFEGTLSEETKTLLNESFSSAVAYLFKGYSISDANRLDAKIGGIKTLEEADKLKDEIKAAKEKLFTGADYKQNLKTLLVGGLLLKMIKSDLKDSDGRKEAETLLNKTAKLVEEKIQELKKK